MPMKAACERLGGFRLVESDAPEGAGGQGTVCRAVCERADFPGVPAGTLVALKVMTMTEPGGDDGRWQRLASAVATLARIDAPNVVRYYGCFRERSGVVDLHVVVMELLDGETLKERLARAPHGLDADEALDIVGAAAAGLAAAAAVGFTHRDVKPENIFLCADGTVKMIDFGIARREGSSATTSGARLLGSFDYMAPERVDAAFRGDACSDVFSLGVVLHEALVGRLPYAAATTRPEFAFFERWRSGAQEGALAVDGRIYRLVPGLDAVLPQALAPDRSGRFCGYAAFGTALSRLKPVEIRSEDETYRLVALVGEGGFGEVFRARRLRDGATVAVKHLKRMVGDAAKRFRTEARAMAGLDDPAFVRFHEYFETGNAATRQAYLVMAYLDGMPGRSLREAITAARGGLPVGEVLSAFIRYAHGLAVLHAHEIVHRDIKPSNLYLPADDAGQAVIMDLGVALDWKATLTAGLAPGTPDYMPPEVILGDSRGSAASDVFALGCCLYEALTGQPAFPQFRNGSAESAEAFLVRARQKRPPRFDAPLVAANPELERLLRQMTEPDVARRMSSAAEAEMELEELLDAFERGAWTVPEATGGEAGPAADEMPVDETRMFGTPVLSEKAQAENSAEPSAGWRFRMLGAALVVVAMMVAAGVWMGRGARQQGATGTDPMPLVPPVPVSVVTQIVQKTEEDTNAQARAAAAQKMRRKLAESQEAQRALAARLREADAKRQKAEREVERKAEEDRQRKVEEQKRRDEAERRKRDEERTRKMELERRRAEYELQMAIVGAQTSAVAVVRHYLDGNRKLEATDSEREAWASRWKGASAASGYVAEFAKALKLIGDARVQRIARDKPPQPQPVPKPPPETKPLPADIRQKLDDAETCLEDEDELGALRLYSEVAAAGWRLPTECRTTAELAFERYRPKNLEAQGIARTRTNSNYNERTLKEELQQARKYLNVIRGEEKGR